jgi:hypothetical protein
MRIKQHMPGNLLLYEPLAVVHHKVPPQRAKFKYLLSRSYSGGLSVAAISRMYAGSDVTSRSTATERSYLGYLLTVAIPSRLRRFYRWVSLTQLFAITASVGATGLGFAVGKFRNARLGGEKPP